MPRHRRRLDDWTFTDPAAPIVGMYGMTIQDDNDETRIAQLGWIQLDVACQ